MRVGRSFPNPCLLIIGYTSSVNSRIFLVPLLYGMKGSLELMHTIISWDSSDNNWTKIVKSLIILSLMFVFSCCLSSSMSYYLEYIVETSLLSFGTQGRYADMIVTFSLFFPPYVTFDQRPNHSKSSPEWVIRDSKLVVEIVNNPPGFLIVFQRVIFSAVWIFFLDKNCLITGLIFGNVLLCY